MDDKPDVDMELNKVITVPKSKQGAYQIKDYLCSLGFSAAHLNPEFDIASHFISSHHDITDTGNQTKHQFIQEAFVF